MRLRTLSFALFILLALSPSLVVSYVLYKQVYQLTESSINKKLERAAHQISSDTLHKFEVLSTALDSLARQELMVYGMDDLFYSSQIFDSITQFGQKYSLIESMYVVASDGYVVESYGGNISAFEESELANFKSSFRFGGDFYRYKPWISFFNHADLIIGEGNANGIALTLPVYSVKRLSLAPIKGYIVAIIPVSFLLDIANNAISEQERVNISFNGHSIGGEKGFSNHDSVLIQQPLALTGGGFRNALWLDLNVMQYRSAIESDIQASLSPVITTAGVFIIVLVLTAVMVAHWVSQAFNQLNDLIQGFELGKESGEKDFFITEFKEASQLFSRLQNTINAQVHKLEESNAELAKIDKLRQKYLDEVEELNVSLENKVESRTQELKESRDLLIQRQDQLVESKKMASLGRLVAGIAHEVNTPLGVAVTGVSSLKDNLNTLEDAYSANKMSRQSLREYLDYNQDLTEIVMINLSKAAQLISDFKMVSVQETHDVKEVINLRTYLLSTLNSLSPRLKRFKPELHISCKDNLMVRCYSGAISQVLTNLVFNSLKHGFEGRTTGKITIDVGLNEGVVKMVYADDGVGMTEENRNKIFEPFFTTKPGIQGGTGLGMHLVYNLVTHKLAGNIQCESQVDEGAKFTIAFPVENVPL